MDTSIIYIFILFVCCVISFSAGYSCGESASRNSKENEQEDDKD